MLVCGFKSFRSMCMCLFIFVCLYMSMLYFYFYGLLGYYIYMYIVLYVLFYLRFIGIVLFKFICYGFIVLNISVCRNVDMGRVFVM